MAVEKSKLDLLYANTNSVTYKVEAVNPTDAVMQARILKTIADIQGGVSLPDGSQWEVIEYRVGTVENNIPGSAPRRKDKNGNQLESTFMSLQSTTNPELVVKVPASPIFLGIPPAQAKGYTKEIMLEFANVRSNALHGTPAEMLGKLTVGAKFKIVKEFKNIDKDIPVSAGAKETKPGRVTHYAIQLV